jgi:H+-transporting ATPase
VSVKFGDGPWQFIGILPMLDPPRHDSGATVRNLQAAGIRVKMITGDHLNIAKETARLIGMGTNICPGEDTRVASAARDQLIWDADGFAQVRPTYRCGFRVRTFDGGLFCLPAWLAAGAAA